MILVHPTRPDKTLKCGMSWTTLFFGPFAALFRGDLKWFFIILVVDTLFGGLGGIFFNNLSKASGFSLMINVFWSFTYNYFYGRDLVKKGYWVQDPADEEALRNYLSL